ncbi:MAG: hypothetical protein ACLSIT_00090 [Christensenellales bacterium]
MEKASGNKNATEFFQKLEKQLLAIHERLGDRSSFSQDLKWASKNVPMSICRDYSGANGRYCVIPALELGENCGGYRSTMAPRYESTAMVLNMRGDPRPLPGTGLRSLSLDGDFDEAGWEKLRSFLYYCEV